MKKWILVASLLWACNSRADEKYSPDINALFDASLIVTGKAILDSNGEVTFTITEVLKNRSNQNLKKEQVITFPCNRYGILSMINTAPIPEDLIVYLGNQKGKWYCYGGSQQVKKLEKDLIPFDFCQNIFWLTSAEYSRMKKQFFTAFRKTGNYTYDAYLTHEEFNKTPQASEVVKQMYLCNKQFNKGPFLVIKEETVPLPAETEEEGEDMVIFPYTEVPAHFPGGDKALYDFINDSIKPQILNDSLYGKIYIRFVVEKDGTLTNFEVLRGINSELDAQIVALMKRMPNWIPAKQYGRPVRSNYVVPIILNLDN